MPKNANQESVSPKKDGRLDARGILLKNFSPVDIENKNPDLYKRLLATFKPLQIADKPEAIHQLMDDYRVWYEANNAELTAKTEKLQREAIEKAKQILAKQGVDPRSLLDAA